VGFLCLRFNFEIYFVAGKRKWESEGKGKGKANWEIVLHFEALAINPQIAGC